MSNSNSTLPTQHNEKLSPTYPHSSPQPSESVASSLDTDPTGIPDEDGLILDPQGGVPKLRSALEDARDSTGAAKGILLSLGWLDRLLSLFIVVAMILGVIIGEFAPNAAHNLSKGDFRGVSAPLVVGLIVMMWPILTKVQYERLPQMFATKRLWYQLAVSLILNWILGPFLMLALAWATLPDLDNYRAGIIMVGLARCIAMVMIWNKIARGDSNTCAIIVIVNSMLQIVLYAPLAVLFLNVISHDDGLRVDYSDVAIAVAIYLGIPLAAGVATRFLVLGTFGKEFFQRKFLPFFSPLSLIALLYTIIIIFAEQAQHILDNLGPVFRTFVPLILYFALMWTGTFALIWWLSVRYGKTEWGYQMAVVQAFTAGSNNFELAIAVCVAVFGVGSDQALAATIGPLVEVPVLLVLSWVAMFVGKRLKWDRTLERRQGQVKADLET
ncbi:related to arsenite transporter ARR3 [Melanopsichium pennsylvanicum]|uniref:Related to arsenite transporter ARR3 n=2 Tax=Melanopsichium pennsylvanicum TaxID=63383 RepID=A0AAJ4XI21_9BASI|nr:related to arsenite transporter ARR3 [Melanopsichium pennsylvanicum 4]SNX82989.1 related to arsenite transporter ARR3 [Melanopsichium pennsylvanicum]